MLASQKQESIREAFRDWVFRDQERRSDLVNKYNELFNSTRPREYDGLHLTFPGMTPDMEKQEQDAELRLQNAENQLATAKVEVTKPFEKEQELNDKLMRLTELNALLNMDEKSDNAVTMDDEVIDDGDITKVSEEQIEYMVKEPETAYEPSSSKKGSFHKKLEAKIQQVKETVRLKDTQAKDNIIIKHKPAEKGAI